jgi:hypothetical protein
MLKDLEDYKSGKVKGIRVSRDFKPVGKRVGVH